MSFVKAAEPAGGRDGASAAVTLCPSVFFLTSPKPRPPNCSCFRHRLCLCRMSAKCDAAHLDYTICAVKGPGVQGREPMPIPRNNPLPSRGSDIFILHPTKTAGVLRCTKEPVQTAHDYMLAFVTNTPAGSSGSPIFNRLHELTGVHRAGGPCQQHLLGERGRLRGAARAVSGSAEPDTRKDIDAVHGMAVSTAPESFSNLMPTNSLLGPAGVGMCHAIPIRTIAHNIQVQLFARKMVDALVDKVVAGAAAESGAAENEAPLETPAPLAGEPQVRTWENIYDSLSLSR